MGLLMEANTVGVQLNFRMNWNQGQEDFLFFSFALLFVFFLPLSSSQPYDSQVHVVKKMTITAKVLMHYRLDDRP